MTSKLITVLAIVTALIGMTKCQFGLSFGNQQQAGVQQQRQNNGFLQQQYPFQGGFIFPGSQNNFHPQNIQFNQRPPQNNQRPSVNNQNWSNRPQQQPSPPPPPPPPQRVTNRPLKVTPSPQLTGRISETKCAEYAKLIKKKIQVASLSLDSVAEDIIVTKCDAVTGLIVGGQNANPDEFPHQCAIGYPDFNGELSFKCGGSLISELFVLTAAHCSKADRTSPTVVRLGDLNLKVRESGLPEIEIPIDSFISHEGYNSDSKENDIALIKMKQPVTFSKSIRPACLQQTETISKSKAVATGWGYTEVGGSTSDILQKVQLDIIGNQQCKDVYDDEDNYKIFPSQLCAGVLKGGKDSCGGDSGGPLQVTMNNECVFSIIGLTSYGSTYCGNKNSPGIYTRISSYLDWIENKVWR